jgi:hypothetical protein
VLSFKKHYTKMSNKLSTRAGNIRKFEIVQANGGTSIDASGGVVDLRYYEDILSNTVSLTATITEVGGSNEKSFGNKGMIDGLPIRGGNPSTIIIEDEEGHVLKFKDDKKLYVNRVRNVIAGTQKDVYNLDFSSRELFANEQCRVVKRYDGKISENVKKILTEATSAEVGIKTKKELKIDETSMHYNFIGNDRKPFYICTWLASKSAPVDAGLYGGAAGYLFYETYDGFNFRSIDVLISEKTKGKYIFTNTADLPTGYKAKILEYSIDRDIDLQNNLSIGLYSNRTLFFDFYAFNYLSRNYSVDSSDPAFSKEGGSKDKIVTAGKEDIDSVADEFRKPVSRLMNRILDVGTLPSGKDIDEQLKTWKDSPFDPTYDAPNIMVQSVMRYNQLFSIKINITIAGDFTLRAGDLIER